MGNRAPEKAPLTFGGQFDEPQPIVLEKNGYTLTAEEMRGTLLLSAGADEVQPANLQGAPSIPTVQIWTAAVP